MLLIRSWVAQWVWVSQLAGLAKHSLLVGVHPTAHCLSGHTARMAVPPGAQPKASCARTLPNSVDIYTFIRICVSNEETQKSRAGFLV